MTRSNRQRNQFYSSTIATQDIETLSQIYEKNSDLQGQDDANDNIGRESLNKTIRPLVCDITDLQVDAIVCPTQSDLTLEPYGLSKTIQIRGGLLLQQTCKQIGKIEVGKAAITGGYDLKCKYVIHTAGPSPNTLLDYNQRKLCLKRSYRSALKLVRETPNIRTVAFPLLGSGGAGIELTDAIRISTTTLRSWLNKPKNAKAVDSIVLCFNDTNQWEKYFPQLIYAFPYGKDLAGFDLEALPKSKINIPLKCCKTNILCYKYGIAQRTIQQHFHMIVNECHDRLCKQFTSEHSDNFSPKLERYDTCAIIQFEHGHYSLIVYNNADLKSIEIQIVCLSSNIRTTDLQTKCLALREIIKDCLASQFHNRLQFQLAVRCEREVIGQRGHLWDMEYLQHSQKTYEKQTCVHACDADTHTLDPVTMLEYWHYDNNFGNAIKISKEIEENSEESDSLNASVLSPPVLLSAPLPVTIRRLSNEIDEGDWPSSGVQTSTETPSDENRRGLHNQPLSGKLTNQALESPDHQENGLNRFQMYTKWRKTSESKLDCSDSKVSDIAQERTCPKESQTLNAGNVFNSKLPLNLENNLNISSITSTGGLDKTNMSKEFSNSRLCKDRLFLNIDPNVSEGSFVSLSPSVYSNCCVTSPLSMDSNCSVISPTSPSVNSNCSVTSPTSEPTLSDRKLLKIARHIGNKQKQLGLELGLSDTEIETLRANNVSDVVMYGYEILKKWMLKRRKRWNCDAILADLMNAMNECDIDTNDLEKALSAMQVE